MNEGYVYFAIKGDDFDPDLATTVLGIQPTSITRKGDPYPRCSIWKVSTEKVVSEVIDIFEMSENIVSLLEHKADEIGRFVQEHNLHAVLEVVLWISMNDSISTPATFGLIPGSRKLGQVSRGQDSWAACPLRRISANQQGFGE